MEMEFYAYQEIKRRATAPDSTKDDRWALANWLFDYNVRSWNGECYVLGNGTGLYPIYKKRNGEDDVDDWQVRYRK